MWDEPLHILVVYSEIMNQSLTLLNGHQAKGNSVHDRVS